MAIRAVLFDLDGTLWGMGPGVDNFDWTEITAMQAEQMAPHFAEWGFRCDATKLIPAFFDNLNRMLRPPTPDHREPPWHPVMRDTLAQFGHIADDPQADVLLDILNDVPFHQIGVRPFPDAAPALSELAARGFKLGSVTNNPKKASRLAREVRDQGLPEVFDTIVSSTDCGWRKPHPIPFQLALTALGVPPDEAAFVGDSLANDIEPALALGMTAVLRSHESAAATRSTPYHTVASLLELPALLRLD